MEKMFSPDVVRAAVAARSKRRSECQGIGQLQASGNPLPVRSLPAPRTFQGCRED